MKTYQVTLKYVAYAHHTIEADSLEEAEAQVDDLMADSDDQATSYGEWSKDNIEEVTP